MTASKLAILAILATAIIWGITLPLTKINLETIPPFSLAFGRFFLASFISLFIVDFSKLNFRSFLQIALISIFGITLHIGLLLFGLKGTSSIDAAFILTLSPLITSLIAVITLREKIIFTHILGIILAFSGTFLYISYPHITGAKELSLDLLADLLILLAVLAETVYIIGSKKLFEKYKASFISGISFFVGAASFSPLATLEIIKDPTWVSNISWFNIFSIIFLGVFSSYIAYTCLEWALTKTPVHINGTLSYLTTIFAIIIATFFLREKINQTFFLSSALVISGVFLVLKFKPKSHHHFHHRSHKV